MNYYNEIKNKLIDNEIYEKVKDYSKERNKVKTYFEIGKLLSAAGKEYGKNIIKQYSEKLMIEVGKNITKEHLEGLDSFMKCFKMKNGPQHGPNYIGATIEKCCH